MMKNLSLFILVLVLSCQGSGNKEDDKADISVSSEQIQQDVPAAPVETPVAKPGPYVEYHPNGEIKMKGVYNQNTQREGLWIAYYDNGVKWSESYYTDGVLNGHSLTFYPNGNVRYMGEYNNGEQKGTWTFYDEAGNLTKEEKY